MADGRDEAAGGGHGRRGAERPEVVVVRHRKERRSKCSLQPLVGRPGLRFLSYPMREVPDLPGFVRLALEGPPLGRVDRGRGLLLLDATWRLVGPMERAFAHVVPRSLPRLETAYPRASKLFADPGPGLASVEALYAALTILGYDAEDILGGYRGRERFLRANAALLRRLASGEE